MTCLGWTPFAWGKLFGHSHPVPNYFQEFPEQASAPAGTSVSHSLGSLQRALMLLEGTGCDSQRLALNPASPR